MLDSAERASPMLKVAEDDRRRSPHLIDNHSRIAQSHDQLCGSSSKLAINLFGDGRSRSSSACKEMAPTRSIAVSSASIESFISKSFMGGIAGFFVQPVTANKATRAQPSVRP